MKKQVIVASLILLVVLVGQAAAQNDPELDRLQEKLTRHLESKMSGWKHKRGEPIQGSKGVLIDRWSASNRVVTISVVRYDSPRSAQEVLQPLIKYERQKEELKGFGDEGYAWGYGLSNIVFRRGKLIITVSTYAEVDSDPDARNLSPSERSERERSEMKRLSQEFAKHMAAAVDQP